MTRHALGLDLRRGRNADWPMQDLAEADGRPILEQLLGGPIMVAPPLDGPQFPPLPAPGEPVGSRPGSRTGGPSGPSNSPR
eukprot:3953667-Heterocapsa_arctica.AAC.1